MSTTVLSKPKFDVYRAITDKIVAAIKAGAGEFMMPWHRHGRAIGRPANAATALSYRGVNVVALWAEAMMAGYGSGTWASFRQWQTLGAHVRKGERGTPIVFYKKVEDGAQGEDDTEEPSGPRFIARASWVFNKAQVEGWERHEPEVRDPAEVLANVGAFIANTKAIIRHGGDMACYRLREDVIHMPERSQFIGTATSSPTHAYYATLLHELTHWTGPSHRLARTFGTRFRDQAYAFEELVAEFGAAFLCADLSVANEPRPDHAAYVAHWLSVLEQDQRAVFTAARLASAAAEYLSNFTAPS